MRNQFMQKPQKIRLIVMSLLSVHAKISFNLCWKPSLDKLKQFNEGALQIFLQDKALSEFAARLTAVEF